VDQTTERLSLAREIFVWFQLVIAYGLIECALWSPRLRIRNRWALAAAIVIVIFLLVDRPSIRRMGLGLPSTLGASIVFAISFAVAVVMIFFVESIGGQIAPMPTWTVLYRSGGYVIWALLQELLLQSFFFTRCEDLFGSSTAVWVAATLFAAASHARRHRIFAIQRLRSNGGPGSRPATGVPNTPGFRVMGWLGR
jgi:hypothetical protein